MIWTMITFAIVFFVLRKRRLRPDPGPDRRPPRSHSRSARRGRQSARRKHASCRELTKQRARAGEGRPRADPGGGRRQAQTLFQQAPEEADDDLRERLAKNQQELEAENRRSQEQIRRDVVELTLLAAEKVTGKTLDEDDQRRLIDETIDELDVNRLVSEN